MTIRITAIPTERRIDPAELAAALEAEPSPVPLTPGLGPMTRFGLRKQLATQTQDAGRVEARLAEGDRRLLDELVASLAAPGFTPTTAQVTGTLLTLALRVVATPGATPLTREAVVEALARG